MSSLTIIDLDENLTIQLRARAAAHGRSVEAEARSILAQALGDVPAAPVVGNLADSIRAIMAPIGGVDLAPFPVEPAPQPVRFD